MIARGEPSLWSRAGVLFAEHAHVYRLGILSVLESGRGQLSVWGTAGTGLGHVSCVVLS